MHDALAANPPVIEQSSGLPRQDAVPQEKVVEKTVAAPEKVEAGVGEQSKIDVTHVPTEAPLPAARTREGVIDPVSEEGDEVARAASAVLTSIPASDVSVDTSAGERPVVELTGEANPTQMNDQMTLDRATANEEWAKVAAGMTEDEGENDIYPTVPEEKLVANFAPTKLPASVSSVVAPSVPDDVATAFDRAAATQWAADITQAQQEHAQAKEKKEADERAEREKTAEEISHMEGTTVKEQLAAQARARDEVAAARAGWQEDLDTADKTYTTKSASLHKEYQGKIDSEKHRADTETRATLEQAEKDAAAVKRAKEAEAEARKQEGERESKGFWGWVKSKAKAFIKMIKDAVNAIFDALRKAVKFIIEKAKQAAVWLIEQARKAIVGFIRAFGAALTLAADVFLAAFPKAREKAKLLIRRGVTVAEETVNKAAEALKAGVSALLDALGAALDFVLALYQKAYNAILDAIEFIVVGLIEIMERIGHLVSAARQMPDHFWGQAQEEVIGMNLNEPLPFERTAAPQPRDVTQAGQEAGLISSQDVSLLERSGHSEADIAVDEVATLDAAPDFLAGLKLAEGEEREFGESPEPERTVGAIKAEALGTEPATPGAPPGLEETEAAASPVPAKTPEEELEELLAQPAEVGCAKEKSGEPATSGEIPESMKKGPFTPGQRGRYLWHQITQGVKQWFACNWPWLLAAAVGAILGVILLSILTGGAILAALPLLMQVVGAIMIGVAIARVVAYVGEYLSLGWEGNIAGAAKSLARSLAIGGIELVFALLFNIGAVIKALRSGLTASVKAAAKAAKATVITTVKNVRQLGKLGLQAGKAAIRNGKLVLKGLKSVTIKGAKSLDELAKTLWQRVRFRKFKIRIKNRRLQLLGYINPWILLADGSVEQVTFEGQGRTQLGETVSLGRRKGIVIGIKDTDEGSQFVKELLHNAKDPNLIKENRALYKKLTGLDFEDARKLLTTYDELGFNSTTEAMRKAVQGKPYMDPIQGKVVTSKPGTVMEPDHTFPVNKMTELPGWDKLSPAQKKAIVYDEIGLDNIKPLPMAMNRSKGGRLAAAWTEFGGKKISPAYRQWLMDEQERIRGEIIKQIKKYLAAQSKQ
jgi:hypothetical protein